MGAGAGPYGEEAEIGEDVVDDLPVLDDRQNLHRTPTTGTDKATNAERPPLQDPKL